jgi:hypothetical protein
MKNKICAILFLLGVSIAVQAQEKLEYFLPAEGVTYDPGIPTPESYFRQLMGEWHLNYEQILSYFNEIARLSGRAQLQEYARSYQNRPLVHLIFTSEDNQKGLDELRKVHYQYSEPGARIQAEKVPLVIFLGYGVHGNESSSTNASVLTAYYLAAARGEKVDNLLKNAIIMIDPSLNPDGFTRHSTWANMHQGIIDMTSPDSRQFAEVWPGGRTNHYWFDLNRDYLPLVHPESRGRVEKFHEWKPNIVTDHHEMGANTTFFFQPGVPSRNNPLTPERNYELTHQIAEYHARYLDKIGSAYYAEETFDDYYFGKGSSYPDANGSIGILFEQAGFRGRIRETDNGVRTLAYGIRNQFMVSLSTLEAAMQLKGELLSFQKEFYESAIRLADRNTVKAYLFGNENDKVKTEMFIDILNRHQIDVYRNERDVTMDGKTFRGGNSFVVPVNQKQFRLIESMFEEVSTFTDSTFYDVSTWTFPYAYNLPYVKLTSNRELKLSSEKVVATKISGNVIGGKNELAYLFRWNEYSAPTALFTLQHAGLLTKVAAEEFSFILNGKSEHFKRGTIMIPVSDQPLNSDEIYRLVSRTAEDTGIDFHGLATGLSPVGIDWGSSNLISLRKPEIIMAAGSGVNSREAGELWHMFDQRYKIPVCLAEPGSFRSINLGRYNVMILPGGSYNELNGETATKIKNWVQDGGILIICPGSTGWSTRNELSKIKFKKRIEPDSTRYLSYADRAKENSLNAIGGAIFMAQMDLTHPLCYGYQSEELPIFKSGNSVAEKLKVKYTEPVNFTGEPYLSGFVSDTNLDRIKNSPVVTVESFGRGQVISFHESMAFRGMWTGTGKLFSNAFFFGQTIR